MEKNGQKGSALLMTLIVMIALTAMVVSFVYVTSARTRALAYDIAAEKAFWLSEAGLADVIHRLDTNVSYRTNPYSVSASLGGGTYSVSIVKNGDTYQLTSTGASGTMNRRIAQSVTLANLGFPEVFTDGLHSFGDISFADSHNGTINGDIAAAGTVDKGSITVNGDAESNVSVGSLTVNFNSYRAIANNVYTSNLTFEKNGTYGAPESPQIWYTTGDAIVQKNTRIYGTIVAEGKVEIETGNNIIITAGTGYPAVIAGDTLDFAENANVTISGLVFSAGTVNIDSDVNFTINGTMIAVGDIDVTNCNNFTFTYNSGITSAPPPFFENYEEAKGAFPQKDWAEVYPAS